MAFSRELPSHPTHSSTVKVILFEARKKKKITQIAKHF